MESNKPVASICHGQQILAAANVLKGKTCTSYSSLKPDILCAGAIWEEVNEDYSNVYVDGNLITSSGWPGLPKLLKCFLELLGTKIEP